MIHGQVNGTNSLQELSSVTVTDGPIPGTGNTVTTMLGVLGIFDGTTSMTSATTAAFNSNITAQADAAGSLNYFAQSSSINTELFSVSARAFISGGANPSYTSIGVADSLAVTVTLALYESITQAAAPDGTAKAVLTANGKRITTTTLPGTLVDTTAAGATASSSYHIVMALQTGASVGKLMACALDDSGALAWSNTNVGTSSETLTGTRYETGLTIAITGSLICGVLPQTGVFRCSLTDGTSYAVVKTPAQIATQAGGVYTLHTSSGQHQLAATTGGTLAVPVIGYSGGTRTAGLVFITAASGAFPVAALTGLTTATTFDTTYRMQVLVVSDGTNFYVALSSSGGNVPTTIKKVSGTLGTVLWTTETTYSSTVRPTLSYLSGLGVLNVYGAGLSIALNATTGAVIGAGIVPSGYRVLALADAGSVIVGATSVAAGSANGPVEVLVAFSAGTMKVAADGNWASVTGGAVFSATAPVIRATQAFGKLYITDGVNYKLYDPSQNAVQTWLATAGTLPTSSGSIARLIYLWGGRIVLTGLVKDPRNIFLLAQGDPLNADYSPAAGTLQTQAVALNASKFGLMGEVVNSCIPYTDDTLLILCANSIWVLSGNPVGSGTLNKITTAVGGAFGNPWCTDPYGNIYFMSQFTGIYRMPDVTPMRVSQMPVRISQQIDGSLRNIDLSTTTVRMQWDDVHQGFHTFATPFASSQAATHYFFEVRSGSWFMEELPNDMNPLCCYTFQGNSTSAQIAVIGSWDGYARTFDATAGSDDGTAISSEIWIGPMQDKTFALLKVKEIQAMMGAYSGTVNWAIKQGQTPEIAYLTGDTVASGTFGAGRSTTQPVGGTAYATYVVITSTNAWSMEFLRLKLGAKGGKTGQRGL